jgi:hypothetical protein
MDETLLLYLAPHLFNCGNIIIFIMMLLQYNKYLLVYYMG